MRRDPVSRNISEDSLPLSPGLQEFVERIGLFYEKYGLPRIGGKIVGLLLIADRPLSLDDMAEQLRISRASASTNTRLAVTFGFAERVGVPGDRRDYYRMAEHAWEHTLEIDMATMRYFRQILERGLAALARDPRPMAQARLEDSIGFSDFYIAERQEQIARWRQIHAEEHPLARPARPAVGGSKPAGAQPDRPTGREAPE
jgi:hypothetical protein